MSSISGLLHGVAPTEANPRMYRKACVRPSFLMSWIIHSGDHASLGADLSGSNGTELPKVKYVMSSTTRTETSRSMPADPHSYLSGALEEGVGEAPAPTVSTRRVLADDVIGAVTRRTRVSQGSVAFWNQLTSVAGLVRQTISQYSRAEGDDPIRSTT